MSDLSRDVYVALDFETSGYAGHYACALGMARIEGDEIIDTWYSLIRPPSSRVYFTRVHGLTWRDLKDAPTFCELWPKIKDFFDGARFFIAHNARFDRGVLSACCQAFALPYPELEFLDTLKGARKNFGLRSNSLDNVCANLNIELNHHHAGSDALGCAMIFLKLTRMGVAPETMLIPRKTPA